MSIVNAIGRLLASAKRSHDEANALDYQAHARAALERSVAADDTYPREWE
jgi:hypothetical protein